ncbi:hypothetical protein [Anaeromyxobacter oryzae]|nr:hypothetical protein [Anaeromyxobacter oryzae]
MLRRVVAGPALLALLGALSACDGTASHAPSSAAQDVSVQVAPGDVQVAPAGTVAFTATVTGTIDTSVVWDVVETGGGAVDGAGLYTAPGAAGTFHVRATSKADAQKQATATVTVTPSAPPPVVAIAVTPRTATVAASGSLAFTAAVSGTSNTAVAWSLQEASGCGTISPTGQYTAPAAAATCHVVATSAADTTKRDVATVTVTAPAPAVAVSVSPASGSTNACQTLRFTAAVANATDTSVTWSVQEGTTGGAVAADGTYTAPSAGGTYHVVATSHADPTKRAIATVVVTEKVLSVAVTPADTTVTAGASAQFTATVTTTCGAFSSIKTIAAAGTVSPN